MWATEGEIKDMPQLLSLTTSQGQVEWQAEGVGERERGGRGKVGQEIFKRFYTITTTEGALMGSELMNNITMKL